MSLYRGWVAIIARDMVIYMDEQQLQTLEERQAFPGSISDNDAAKHLNEARSKLFKAFSQ